MKTEKTICMYNKVAYSKIYNRYMEGGGGEGLRRGGDGVGGEWCLTSLQEIFVSYLV